MLGHTASSELEVELLHVLFVEIHQDSSSGISSAIRRADRHIGVESVQWSIWWIVSVGKAHFNGERRIAHEFGTPRHVWVLVRIRVHIQENLILAILKRKESCSDQIKPVPFMATSFLHRDNHFLPAKVVQRRLDWHLGWHRTEPESWRLPH